MSFMIQFSLASIIHFSLIDKPQVFVRELISNASDALEKLRYMSLTSGSGVSQALPLEIHMATNQEAGTITIQVSTILMGVRIRFITLVL